MNDVHPKSWTKNLTFRGVFFMGKHYKYEFKLKVVQEYLNSLLGYRALTKKYEISNKSLIERWVTQYKEFGPEGLSKRLKIKCFKVCQEREIVSKIQLWKTFLDY
ncbi:transposase [Staphylococcus saprophyticus subsp. saprophyticus ATCC 15305 = NCTC 7292]|uniref:helix-turn-helix domain-containing protein n=3 Tax=Staphylococcus saprophyticus TaxID=29385 RepID=UPI000D042ECE|nr:hypothetical protein CEQ33_11005 [Staphylococcus saprophyticus]QCY41853.1 transposase [Staphylococcus saprophyticus subsp. saprophyticus ATCC 15305 = NCTC 7292]